MASRDGPSTQAGRPAGEPRTSARHLVPAAPNASPLTPVGL